MVEGIVGGVVAGVILGALGWLWNRREHPRHWLADQEAKAEEAKELVLADEVVDLRTQVLKVAGTLGKVLPASAAGTNPTVVTFSDGGKTLYYRGDLEAYKRAMNSGRVDLSRTMLHHPPSAVSEWDRSTCEDWLAKHPL